MKILYYSHSVIITNFLTVLNISNWKLIENKALEMKNKPRHLNMVKAYDLGINTWTPQLALALPMFAIFSLNLVPFFSNDYVCVKSALMEKLPQISKWCLTHFNANKWIKCRPIFFCLHQCTFNFKMRLRTCHEYEHINLHFFLFYNVVWSVIWHPSLAVFHPFKGNMFSRVFLTHLNFFPEFRNISETL